MNINWDNYRANVKDRVFEWLDEVADMIGSGTIDQLKPAPFYERRDVLTDEIIEGWCRDHEAYLLEEITKYPGYHNREQGTLEGEVLVTPGFDTMPPLAKRAMVERLDEMLQEVRGPDVYVYPYGAEYFG